MTFSTGKRPDQARIEIQNGKPTIVERAGPSITAHGAVVVTPEGRRLAVMGDRKDPFAVHEDYRHDRDPRPEARTIRAVEDRVDEDFYSKGRRQKVS